MSRPRIYISGPMTGYFNDNKGAFMHAEGELERSGYKPINPARHPEQSSWVEYLKLDLADVLGADGVAVLPGWETSRGACLEVHVAQALGITVMPIIQWLRK